MLFTFLACIATEEDTAVPELEAAYAPTIAKVTWNNNSMLVTIEGPKRDLTDDDTSNDIGVGTQYYFGLVESKSATGDSCLEQSIYGCWTGEDCSGQVYTPPSGVDISNKCHTIEGDVSETETAIISQDFEYSQSIIAYINEPDLSSGTTAFPSPSTEKYEYRVTYYLEDIDTGSCWAWGVEPSYFDDRNCNIPSRYQDLSIHNQQIVILD